MTNRKIQHVTQKHDKGCVVACIAMVLGWEYDKVAAEFRNDFDKKGISTDFAKELVCAHGYSAIEKRGTVYINRFEHNKRMMTPFAPIHIVSVQQFVDLPRHTHAVVMDAKGRLYDPGDKQAKELLFYEVRHIIGFFEN